ncbi:MAG: hypothetical protein AAGE52_10405 [Myxococcota bacterium]
MRGESCTNDEVSELQALVDLETDQPIDIELRCGELFVRVALTHRATERTQDLELDASEGVLRNLSLQIGEAAELLAVPVVVREDPPPPPPPPPPFRPSRVSLVMTASAGADQGGSFRGGAELGLRYGENAALLLGFRMIAGPEPGTAVSSVWIAAAGAGIDLEVGDATLRGNASITGWVGPAWARPDQARASDRLVWFGVSLRAGPVLRLSERWTLGLLGELLFQRRLGRTVTDDMGRVVEEAEGRLATVLVAFRLRVRLGEVSPPATEATAE